MIQAQYLLLFLVQSTKAFRIVCDAIFYFLFSRSIPVLSFLFENASWKNIELQHFTRSLLVLPAYMTALGIINVGVAAILAIMVFSSQIAHRLMFRYVRSQEVVNYQQFNNKTDRRRFLTFYRLQPSKPKSQSSQYRPSMQCLPRAGLDNLFQCRWVHAQAFT